MKTMIDMEEDTKDLLTQAKLKELGFGGPHISEFPNLCLKYMALGGILMFFNEGEMNKNSFLVGYGEMREGTYYATTFRWIKTVTDLERVFMAVCGKSIYSFNTRR